MWFVEKGMHIKHEAAPLNQPSLYENEQMRMYEFTTNLPNCKKKLSYHETVGKDVVLNSHCINISEHMC